MERENSRDRRDQSKTVCIFFFKNVCLYPPSVCWHELIAEECGGKLRNRKSPSERWAQSSHTHKIL